MAKNMMDIGVDGSGDLKVVAGDWVVEESTAQHQVSLLMDAPGEYPFAPLVGVGVVKYEDDEGPEDLAREITQQFMQDGMEVKDLTADPASITDSSVKPFVNAYYQ